MAIHPRNVDKITDALTRIFKVDVQTYFCEADGGYENLYVIVQTINTQQLIELTKLVADVPNLFVMRHLPDGIQLLFF